MPSIQSLDPRINRLSVKMPDQDYQSVSLDQFPTFEVFQLVKEGKPFEHTGIVHAPDEDFAFLFAKEQFSRRGNACLALAIAPTSAIMVSAYTDGSEYASTLFPPEAIDEGSEAFEVFYLKKRGKQHVRLGTVHAGTQRGAAAVAAQQLASTPNFNLWVLPSSAVLFSSDTDRDFWHTLPEKKYREAIAYKSSDRIDRFKAEQEGK